MVEYGVVTTNKFHFLSDDEDADPSEILAKAAQIKKTKGTSISKVPQNVAPTTTNLPKPEKPQTETANKENTTAPTRGRGGARGGPRGGFNSERGNGREGNRDNRRERREEGHQEEGKEGGERRFDGERRGGRGGPRGGGARGGRFGGEGGDRERRPPRQDGEHQGERRTERRPFRQDGEHQGERRPERRPYPRTEGDAVPTEGLENMERRPTRGGGRGYSGRGGRGAPRGDRMSGSDRTGVRGAPKKDGHGKGNWGTENDELQGETEPIPAEATDVEKPTEEATAEDNADKNDSGVEIEKEEEKQPVGMTLSEWKEKNKAVETEAFNVRKPNDDKKLNLAPLKKAEDGDKDNEEFVVLRREPREKHVDISVNFATTDRGFSDRGGRGRDGFRGGRGRGGADRGDRDTGREGNRERGGDRGEYRGRGGMRGDFGRDRNNRGGNSQFNLATEQFPALGAR